MKLDRDATMDDVAKAFHEVMPNPEDQRLVFSQLIESIDVCEQLGSTGWSVSILDSGFRLNVGQVEALTCFFGSLPLPANSQDQPEEIVDIRILLAGSDCVEMIPPSSDYGRINELRYKSVGSQHWCYTGSFLPSAKGSASSHASALFVKEHFDLLRNNHHQFLQLACHTSTGKIRSKSNFARYHCQAVVDHAIRVVRGSPVPAQPHEDIDDMERGAFQKAVLRSLRDNLLERAARLAVAPQLPDRIETTTIVFRRNPDVVAEVLIRASGRCESCRMPAPFLRASDGSPYLEVHHKTQLAAGGFDTVDNAIALCPNCHREKHYGQ